MISGICNTSDQIEAIVFSMSSTVFAPEQDFWALTALRPGSQLEYTNSYAHDIRKSFALAHYQDSILDAQTNPELSDWNARWAAVLDPEDYHLVLK